MANVAHSSLTGSDLHEPKGVAAAAANKVYVTNGGGSGAFTLISTFAGALGNALWWGQELQTNGTNGAALTSGSWNTRAINTEVVDDLTLTLSSNQLSLVAGTYVTYASAGVHFTGSTTHGSQSQHVMTKLRVRNISDGTTVVDGPSARQLPVTDDGGGNDASAEVTLYTTLMGRFVLAGTKTIELQNYVSNAMASNVLSKTTVAGKAVSSGENEIYADWFIVKVA